jgi:hypothetical protein
MSHWCPAKGVNFDEICMRRQGNDRKNGEKKVPLQEVPEGLVDRMKVGREM